MNPNFFFTHHRQRLGDNVVKKGSRRRKSIRDLQEVRVAPIYVPPIELADWRRLRTAWWIIIKVNR